MRVVMAELLFLKDFGKQPPATRPGKFFSPRLKRATNRTIRNTGRASGPYTGKENFARIVLIAGKYAPPDRFAGHHAKESRPGPVFTRTILSAVHKDRTAHVRL